MSSSRAGLKRPSTRSGSREVAFSVENPYKPGFLDPSTPASFQMSVDSELSAISNAFYQQAEVTSNVPSDEDIEEIQEDLVQIEQDLDSLTIRVGNVEGDVSTIEVDIDSIELRVSNVEGDVASIQVEVDNIELRVGNVEGDVAAIEIEVDSIEARVGNVEGDVASIHVEVDSIEARITNAEGDIISMEGELTDLGAHWGISTNVNGKVSGIQLNNDGQTSEFNVIADRFTISDGTSNSTPPFEVVNGTTRIKSAYVNTLQSDNWNGSTTGWFISNAGDANFQNVTVRGTVNASNSFTGVGAGGNLVTCYDGSSYGSGPYVNLGHITVSTPLEENALMVIHREMEGTQYNYRWVNSGGSDMSGEKYYGGLSTTHTDLISFALPKGFSGTLYHQVHGNSSGGVDYGGESRSSHDGYWFLIRAI